MLAERDVDHVTHAHVGIVREVAGGEEHIEIHALAGAVAVDQLDGASACVAVSGSTGILTRQRDPLQPVPKAASLFDYI